jgi:dTDP-glucose 4,6-dehydratase
MNYSILITGGAGFIGGNFIARILSQYEKVNIINYDILSYASNQRLLKYFGNFRNYHFVHADIRDRIQLKRIIESLSPNIIVNFAAESHVDRSIINSTPFITTNIGGTQNLLELCRDFDITKYIQISTDEVYGSLGHEGSFTENSPLHPRSPYSASKASADLLVQAYHETYGIPVNITRCTNNYGPWQYPEKLIPLTIKNCLEGKKIPVYGNGENIRDWVHVQDHCDAITLVIEKANPGEIFNIGSNNEWNNISLIREIIEQVKKIRPDLKTDNLISYVPDRQGHDFRYSVNCDAIKQKLGWETKINFKDGLKETIKWYCNNYQWLDINSNTEYSNYYALNYTMRGEL